MRQQATVPEDSLIGTLLDGRYRVDSVLAHGGMSTVYQGTDTRLDRTVAIKVMSPRLGGDPAFLQRFEREARAAARLHHPGVVGIYDQGIDRTAGEHAFLVMELVDGGTLRDLLREYGTLPVPLALTVADQVLAALSTAHQQGLVHRDIKPENVLIGSGGEVKVADFGLVRAAAEAGKLTGDLILGTVAYLSPEQVSTGSADSRSDVYATGILLFEMLTGAPPYDGETALSVAYRHVNDDVPAPATVAPEVPSAVSDLVIRATRREPGARPADAAALCYELRRVCADLALEPVPVPVPVPESAAASGDWGPDDWGPDDWGPGGTRALHRAGSAAVHAPVHASERYQQERLRARRVFISWMLVVLLLASAVGGAGWWLGSGRWTVVPDLSGLEHTAVERALADARLSAYITEVPHDSVPTGVVVDTDPAAGEQALRGSPVTVLLSVGRPVVPDLPLGIPLDQVERALTAAGLRAVPDPEAAQFHDTVPDGTLVGTVPAAGTVLTVDAPVTVVLSKGPAPTVVPAVRGLPEAEATTALTNAGLAVQVRREFDNQIPGGQAVDTTPRGGTETRRGRSVELVVSTALVVPDVVGQPRAQAFDALASAGFQPLQDGDDARQPHAIVVATQPAAGALVRPDDNVVTVRTTNQVVIPDVVGLSVDEARRVLAAAGLDSAVRQFFGNSSSRVLTQSPRAGRTVPPGSTVRLRTF